MNLSLVLLLNDTVYLLGSRSCREDRVEAVDSLSDVQNGLIGKLILIFHDELVVGLSCDLVFDVCLQIAD